jgi:hypothetical protein
MTERAIADLRWNGELSCSFCGQPIIEGDGSFALRASDDEPWAVAHQGDCLRALFECLDDLRVVARALDNGHG